MYLNYIKHKSWHKVVYNIFAFLLSTISHFLFLLLLICAFSFKNYSDYSLPKFCQFYWYHSVHFSCSVVSNCLQPHGLQHARLPCPSPTPRACSNSCQSSQWCHSTISSSVVPVSSHLRSFPASGSFPMSWLFASRSRSIAASASASNVFSFSFSPSNEYSGWFPLGLTGLISLLSKSLFQRHNTKASVLRHSAFFMVQLKSRHDFWKNHSLTIWTLLAK